MAGLGDLVVRLSAETAQFTQALDKASYQSQKNFQNMVSSAKTAGIAIAGVLGVGSFAGFIKSSIDAQDALNDLSERTGIAVEQLSKLQFIAKLSDTTVEALQAGLSRLSKGMVDASLNTGEAKKAFEAMGISIFDTNGKLKSNIQVLSEVSDKFAGYADGAEKVAIGQKIFGRGVSELIPFLNQGSAGIEKLSKEFEQLGGVVTKEAAQASGQFNDNLDKLVVVSSSLGRSIANTLLPTMNAFLESLINAKKFAKENESTIVGLATSIGVLSASFVIYAQRVAIVSASTAVFNAVAGAIAIARGGTVAWTIALATLNTTLNLTKVALIGSGIGAFAVALGTITANMYEQMSAKGKERIAVLEKEKQAILDNVENTEKYIKSEAKKEEIRKNRAKRLKEIDDEIAKEKELTKASEGTGKPPAPVVADEKYAKFLTQAADAVKDFGRAQEEVFAKRQFDISSVFMTDEMKNYQQDLIAINKAYETAKDRLTSLSEAGNITSSDFKKQLQMLNSTYDESIVKAQEMFEKQEQLNGSFSYGATVALSKYVNESRNLAKLTEGVVTNAINGLDNALLGIITRTTSVADAFKSMTISILSDMAKILIRQSITAPIANALAGAIGGAFTSNVNLGSQSLGSSSTGSTGFGINSNASLSGMRAGGGSVGAGNSYLVGEMGAEIFTPNSNGMITPNNQLGGSTNVVVNVNMADGTTNAQEGNQLGILIGNVVKAELVKQKRAGGLLA